ncbi:MAG: hypothetical protein A3J79_13685 [Elusimicrobia bacterium RIFOXYB2_FULL_62_6]|nr:MAG: hypothetical protein A3J79_13685 [Elusimicrobia bacterium RIFOXYB2_FULL_62_6]
MPLNTVLYRRLRGPLRTFFSASLIFLFARPAALGADYDISYLWHPDPASVAAYRTRVAKILGPEVAGKLRVVRGADNYGLIYRRRGGLDSARTVARAHSRILSSRGLQPAAWVPARNWAARRTPPAQETPTDEPRAEPAPSGLEADIEAHIKDLRRRGLIGPAERTAWAVYDLSSDKKLVSINEDLPLSAASLIKPFIALAYFHEAAAGRAPYDSRVRARMERMIRDSDNAEANWFFRRLGGPAAVQRLLKRNYGALLRGISIVEYIPPGGRTYRNKASAHDYSRFLHAMWNGQLPRSSEIKRLMNLPKRDRLYTSVPGVPEGVEVYDKTGTTSRLCGDMGILVAKEADGEALPYIIVGVIESGRSSRDFYRWMRTRGDVIRQVSEMVYREIAGPLRSREPGPFNAGAASGGGSAAVVNRAKVTDGSI